jgi:choice-of-anchor A domain-containing protein
MFTPARLARGHNDRVTRVVATASAVLLAAVSLVLASPTAASAAPVTGNPLAGLAGFTLVSSGDITLGNHELEGSVAAGGDVRVNSGSPYNVVHSAAGNSGYALPRASDGTYLRLIAGGTFDVAGSTNLLRVSSGGNLGTAATQGLIALGDTGTVNVTSRGSGVCAQAVGVNDCSGAALEQSNFGQTVASVTRPGIFDEFIDAAARSALLAWSDRIANDEILDTVAVSLASAGSDYALELTAGKVNVWTVNASVLPAGDWKLAFNGAKPSATTPLVIRVLAADGAVINLPLEVLGFQDAPGGVTDNNYARFMLWNIPQSAGQSVSVTSNGIVPGSFLAPNSVLTTGPGSKTLIEGQIYAAEVSLQNGGEIHHYAFTPELSYDGVGPATGGFSISKALSGPGGLVPAATEFTVEYSVDGGAPQQLTLLADGTVVTVSALPAGALVTFVETVRPTLPGVVWGAATFSPATVTITAGATTAVTLTNVYTAASVDPDPALASQPYVGGTANGTVRDPGTPIVDEVYYSNVEQGAAYTLRAELVYLENGAIQRTGISADVEFEAASSAGTHVSGQVDMPFTLSESQIQNLAGKRILIFQSLFDANGALLAFDGATAATDPWFATTPEWFRVARLSAGAGSTGSDTPGSLALTGSDYALPLRAALLALLLGAALTTIGMRRRSREG